MLRNITDTHAHMDDPVYAPAIDDVMASEAAKGVSLIITSGSEIPSCYRSIALAERYPMIYASVGVYPNEVNGLQADYLTHIRALAAHPRCVAIGEIGLDYGYSPDYDKELQMRIFSEQFSLAEELGYPVVMHDRDADADLLPFLESRARASQKPLSGTIHRYFSGVENGLRYLDLGLCLSVGPQITYEDREQLMTLVRIMPTDRLLLETDAPFLPTARCAGTPAYPSMIAEVAVEIAKARGDMTPQEVLDLAKENMLRLFPRIGK